MCRLMFPLMRSSLILALVAFGAVVASRAQAGLIPVTIEQSPFEVDVLLEWTEEGTEELLVLSGLDDWAIQVKILDNTATTGQWDLDILVSHRIDPLGGSRRDASGGFVASIDNGLFGQVLSLESAMLHSVVEPLVEGYIPPPQTPHFDLLFLDVIRDPIADAARPSTIHIRGKHVPEPGSISLLLIALVLVGLAYRRFRSRVSLRR